MNSRTLRKKKPVCVKKKTGEMAGKSEKAKKNAFSGDSF